jgi:hypothetical protein
VSHSVRGCAPLQLQKSDWSGSASARLEAMAAKISQHIPDWEHGENQSISATDASLPGWIAPCEITFPFDPFDPCKHIREAGWHPPLVSQERGIRDVPCGSHVVELAARLSVIDDTIGGWPLGLLSDVPWDPSGGK